MRVLILGANGFIGQAITQSMQPGVRVVGLTRTAQRSQANGTQWVAGDRADVGRVVQIVREYQIDVVIDVIAMLLADSEPLIEALDGQIDQYVLISSADVYRNYELLQRRADGESEKNSLDEDAPLRTTRFPYRGDQPRNHEHADRYLDDYDKIPIEQAVRNMTSSAWTVLRLPMVFGPGDKQRRFLWAVAPMLRDETAMSIPREFARWCSTYGYIDNVGAAVTATLGNARARNGVFNIAEQNPVCQVEWAQKFARSFGWNGEIRLTDDPDHPMNKGLSTLNLDVPFKIDGSRFRRTFGFTDPVPEPAAIERTIEDERQRTANQGNENDGS